MRGRINLLGENLCIFHLVHKVNSKYIYVFCFIAGVLPCTVLIPGLFFIPESPRWLVWIKCYAFYCLNFCTFLC
jgi:hypothetical protein